MRKLNTISRGWLAALAASALVALVGWLAVTSSILAAANQGWVDPASATVVPGGDVTVSIMGQPPAGTKLGGWNVTVTYDNAVLDATSCGGGAYSSCNADLSPTSVGIAGFNATGLEGAQTLGSITFHALGAAGASSALTVAITEFNDETGTAITPAATAVNGNVAVQAATATPTPVVTPAVIQRTGGAPGDDGSGLTPWLLVGLGIAVIGGGVWATTRMRRDTN